MNIQRFTALELETGSKVGGYYYLENGFWMNGDIPDLRKPVERHYMVDDSGQHREICVSTLEKLGDNK